MPCSPCALEQTPECTIISILLPKGNRQGLSVFWDYSQSEQQKYVVHFASSAGQPELPEPSQYGNRNQICREQAPQYQTLR